MDTIKKAVREVGGVTVLARAVGVTPVSVHTWLRGGTQLQARHAAAVEDATGGAVSAYDIGRECTEIAERGKVSP